MPVNSITIQPAAGDFKAAYRPVFFHVLATATNGSAIPPVVYADLYLDGTYYRTISKLIPTAATSNNSIWEFDLQAAIQEVLSFFLVPLDGGFHFNDDRTIAQVQVKFRASGIDNNGFTVPEGTVPVQATGMQPAVAGGGLASHAFYVVNTTLRHTDNQSLPAHLASYKTGEWLGDVLPLTHRPAGYQLCLMDFDTYPVLTNGTDELTGIRALYKTKTNPSTQTGQIDFDAVTGPLLQAPSGPANLVFLPADVTEYVVQGIRADGAIMFTTPLIKVGGCCDDERKRIVFKNYLGTMDSISFLWIDETDDTKSGTFRKALKYPLDVSQHTTTRSDVEAGEVITVRNTHFQEQDMDWIKECRRSGLAWEVQGDTYLPIVILDGSQTTRKEEGRYVYEVILKYRYSNEFISQRQ